MSGSPKLSVEPWLAERASRDDPPSTIEPALLARFAQAGVDRLAPTSETETLPADQADSATGVGALGPGFGFGETFEDEPAPLAGALERLCVYVQAFDRLRRLRLAAIDMRLVQQAAAGLIGDGPAGASSYSRVIETGLVVTYARPYLQSRAGLGRKWWPKGESDRALHDHIIDVLRNPYHAHADHTPRRTLTDTTAMLGMEGPPTWAEAWWTLTDDDLRKITDLARKQAERFEEAALAAGAELGEEREPPGDGWNIAES